MELGLDRRAGHRYTLLMTKSFETPAVFFIVFLFLVGTKIAASLVVIFAMNLVGVEVSYSVKNVFVIWFASQVLEGLKITYKGYIQAAKEYLGNRT